MYDMAYQDYSNEDVLRMLEDNRIIDFEYELLSTDEKVITTLEDADCTVTFNSEAEIMGTVNITFLEQEKRYYYTDLRVRPWFKIKAPDDTWIRHPLGIYIITTPVRKHNGGNIYIEADCYDKSIILKEDKVTDRFFIKSGSFYVNEVRNVLMSAGINKTIIESSDFKTTTDLEFEIGTSKLDIINALLMAINYTPIHFDRMGNAVSNRYIEPDQRTAEYEYMTDDESLVVSGTTQTNDLYNIPNIVTRYVENPDMPYTWMKSTWKNENDSSPLSISRRGRKIVDIESVDDIADMDTLKQYTRRIGLEKSQINDDVVLPTAIMPHHSYRDCIYVRHDKLKIACRYVEYAWEMRLAAGETMKHTLKKVIRL